MNIFSKRLFTTFFVLLLGAVYAGAQNRISLTWEVIGYDLAAELPRDFTSDRDLDVTASMRLKNIGSDSSSTVSLRISEQAEVSAVRVNGTEADFRKNEEKIGGNRSLQKIVTRITPVSSGQTVTVSVTYRLKVAANSGLNALSPVNSQFLPLAHWYPTPTSWYFPGGADYAPFDIRVTAANGESVLSSGAKTEAGFSQKLSAQPFFVTGRWEQVTANGVEVYVPKGMSTDGKIAAELADIASGARTYTAGLLGKSPDTPLRIVGVSRGAGFSDGGTIFVDESVFLRRKVDSQTAVSVIEGVVKLWLGNIYKVQDDGYGVIREGLARHIATGYIEQRYGKPDADLERLRQRTNYSAISLRDVPLNIVSPVDAYYYTATANKGAMIWNYLNSTFGDDMYALIRAQAEDGELTMRELRTVFASRKDYLDYMIDRITEMNLMIGLPQQNGGRTKVALRNMSEIDVVVDVEATASDGEKLSVSAPLKAGSFGEAVFTTPKKIVRVEVDADKIYPQTDYSDDIAPREIGDNDALVFIKKEFDRQKYAEAEKNARTVLEIYPIYDDARVLLARAQLAQGKVTEAQRNFEEIFKLKLPTAQSLAWASVGLGEIAARTGQTDQAWEHYAQAIRNGSELGATIAARRGRVRLKRDELVSKEISDFFTNFDKAVVANSKSQIDALIVDGEIARFAGNVAGQAQQWASRIVGVDRIDDNTLLVETDMTVKLLNREVETGMAVYRLVRVGNQWRLSDVEIFEVG